MYHNQDPMVKILDGPPYHAVELLDKLPFYDFGIAKSFESIRRSYSKFRYEVQKISMRARTFGPNKLILEERFKKACDEYHHYLEVHEYIKNHVHSTRHDGVKEEIEEVKQLIGYTGNFFEYGNYDCLKMELEIEVLQTALVFLYRETPTDAS